LIPKSEFSIWNSSLNANNPDEYFSTFTDKNIGTIASTFFNTAFDISDKETLQEYFEEFTQTVNNSKDLSDNEKTTINTYSSIATGSLLYHYF